MSTPLSLEISLATRNAFRRIRNAVTTGKISIEEMQEYSEKVSNSFAKALLSLEKPALLKESDRESNINHVENLNAYVENLLKDEPRLNVAGNSFDNSSVTLLVQILTKETILKRYGHPESTIVALLSTGALNLALLSYIYDLKIMFAAVNRTRDQAFVPPLPDGPITVIDDVLGKQALVTAEEISQQGHKVKTKNILGM